MWWIIQFIVMAVASFFFWKLVSGKTEGEHGKVRSLRFNIGQYTIWFHHWIYLTIALFILYYIGIYNALLYGFIFGGIIQGLYYKDFYYIFFKTKNYPFKKL